MSTTNCMKNRRLTNQRSLHGMEGNGTLLSLLVNRMELTQWAHTGTQICQCALMCHSHCECCFGEQVSWATCQPVRVKQRAQWTVRSPMRWRDNWACWQNSLHVQQSSQMCNSLLTSEFPLLYSNLTRQTCSSSLSGTGSSPEDPVKSPGLVTVNCKLLPCTNTRTLAMTHNRRLSSNLPGIFCSKLIKRNSA